MNWRQLYTAAEPHQRLELMLHMLQVIERRQRRLIFVRGRFLRERRHSQLIHWINDRRQAVQRRYKLAWIYGIAAVTISAWLSVFFVPPAHGAFMVIASDLLLITILYVKPYLRWQPASISARIN